MNNSLQLLIYHYDIYCNNSIFSEESDFLHGRHQDYAQIQH